MADFTKMKHAVPYDLAITHMGIYPREIKIYVHTKICRKKIYLQCLHSYKPETGNKSDLFQQTNDFISTFKPLKIMKKLKGRYKCLEVYIIYRNFV